MSRYTAEQISKLDAAAIAQRSHVHIENVIKDLIETAKDALAASGGNAAPALPEPLEINWPTLNPHALGCGVEDRGLHDRYECAEYGWEDGVDRAIECVPEAIYDADQMREYGKACHAVGRGAAVREYIENGTFKDVAAPNAALVALKEACDLIRLEVADGEHTEEYRRGMAALAQVKGEK